MKVDEDYENTVKMQQALYDVGFFGKTTLNRAVDGKHGKGTQKALEAAEKAGYIFKDGQLVKKASLVKKSPENSYETVEKPGFWSDLSNFVLSHHSATRSFMGRPYRGSEEEARKLGYKYYTDNGFTRYPVDYSVKG